MRRKKLNQAMAACCISQIVSIAGSFLLLSTTSANAQVIVDNDDGAPAYVESGGWSASGSAGYDGGTYRFATGGGAHSATWTATLPTAGDYEVFVWYVPGSNRATAAKYDIIASDGPHTVFVNQTGGGYTFDSIGTFNFNAGSNTITLDAAGSTNGSVVIADAVRFGGSAGGECTLDSTDEVRPDVFHKAYTCPAPRAIHVLEFDLQNPEYTIDMGFSLGKRNYGGLNEPVSSIANRYDTPENDVVGAINASFSEPGLSILGMLGSGGNLIATRDDTWWDQQTYMLMQSGEGWAGSDLASAVMTARFADATEIPIDILDYPCSANSISVYTPDWDDSTGSTAQGVEVIVENVNYPLRPNKELVGTITAIHTGAASTDNAIPENGFVLAACSGAEATLLSHVTVGEQVSVRFDMSPPEFVNLKTLCTGNAWMVKDGAPFHGGGPERHPRTVLAWSGTKHWFVTFDGRQPGYSIGANVGEMTEFLIDTLQVENAINLDGGGSTTMVVDDEVVNCPSDGAATPCTGNERHLPNALLLVERDATSSFPLEDPFSAPGRSLPWDDKFRFNPLISLSPETVGHIGLEVLNPDGGFETVSVGAAGDHNYTVSTDILCEYRPEVAADGFERVGIFARDDGNGNFDSTTLGGGNCYALTFDSNDGRIRAGVVVDGVFTDFLESAPHFAPSTNWRTFEIDCRESKITFSVDDEVLVSATDSTHTNGRFGIGYHEYFNSDLNILGTRADNFRAIWLDFDWDDDGDVDLTDFNIFALCASGPATAYPEGHICLSMDGSGDLKIDLADFQLMQEVFTGN
ncbi:MAG: hypothetical protein DHS20C16_04960 [Phycisphaerae bacterium]|nr:MAG: hypothetical protein DHS20C16_04960 [Phycisphaerae bacterium]